MLIQLYKVTRLSKGLSYSFFIATLLCSEICGVFQTCHIKYNPDLDDLSTSSWMFREVSLKSSFSKFECPLLCLREPSCVTYMVNRNTRVCRMFGARITRKNQLSSQPGFKAYDTCRADAVFGNLCNSNSDCRMANSSCIENICQCDHGWSYSSNDLQCVRACVAYGPEFTIYPGGVLVTHNDAQFEPSNPANLTPEKCKENCIKQTDFVCRSYDWEKDSFCFMSSDTSFDEPNMYITHPLGSDEKQHGQRQCKYTD